MMLTCEEIQDNWRKLRIQELMNEIKWNERRLANLILSWDDEQLTKDLLVDLRTELYVLQGAEARRPAKSLPVEGYSVIVDGERIPASDPVAVKKAHDAWLDRLESEI